MSDEAAADARWFAWDRMRRLASQLQAALEQAVTIAGQLVEAIEAAEPTGDRPPE